MAGDVREDVDEERPCVEDREGSEEELESGYAKKGGIRIDCKDVRLFGIALARRVCVR